MENKNLERDLERLKEDVGSIILELISEIEEKELIIESLQDEVNELKYEIQELNS
jgi:peptidoglycan hydrolase CwlO-like protein